MNLTYLCQCRTSVENTWWVKQTRCHFVKDYHLINYLVNIQQFSDICRTRVSSISLKIFIVKCSPLVPVVRSEVGHGYCHPFFIFSFVSSLSSPHRLLCQPSPTPFIFCCSPSSSHSFQIFVKLRWIPFCSCSHNLQSLLITVKSCEPMATLTKYSSHLFKIVFVSNLLYV